jgi:hypothetical protein
MKKINYRIFTAVLLLWIGGMNIVEADNSEQPAQVTDHRQLVEMPAEAQQLMRKDMQDHLLAMSEIFGYLAESNFVVAAEVAEKRMGKSSMGKHRAAGMGPGRFMPPAMRQIGVGMHEAVSNFAEVAKSGDLNKTYAALQTVMASCAACHMSFRVR